MSRSIDNAAARTSGSMLSPALDFLLVGGLSLIVLVPLLLSGRTDLVIVSAGVQAWLAATINMPHFMASYRLIYRSRTMIMRHKWASIYLPLILIAYIAVALFEARTNPFLVIVLITVSSVYLAWHYTGQVWGMMASFAFLAGAGFDKTEKRLIRTSLRILIAWHLTWFLYTQLRDPSTVRWLYFAVSGLTLIGFVVGAIGLVRMSKRTGKAPPALTIVAWVAIFVWYAAMARDPKALFWIQIFHALQYMAFPVRLEINRHVAAKASSARGAAETTEPHGSRLILHMLFYGVMLLAVSVLLSRVLPASAMSVVGNMFGEEPGKAAPVLILMFINIHHYFTDGVMWKISNAEVRQDLFAHVKRPQSGVAKAPNESSEPRKGERSREGKQGRRKEATN
jgi:hypothetical protein